jgi:hypothetical protein
MYTIINTYTYTYTHPYSGVMYFSPQFTSRFCSYWWCCSAGADDMGDVGRAVRELGSTHEVLCFYLTLRSLHSWSCHGSMTRSSAFERSQGACTRSSSGSNNTAALVSRTAALNFEGVVQPVEGNMFVLWLRQVGGFHFCEESHSITLLHDVITTAAKWPFASFASFAFSQE